MFCDLVGSTGIAAIAALGNAPAAATPVMPAPIPAAVARPPISAAETAGAAEWRIVQTNDACGNLTDRRQCRGAGTGAGRARRGADHGASAAPSSRPLVAEERGTDTLKGVPEPTALYRLVRARVPAGPRTPSPRPPSASRA